MFEENFVPDNFRVLTFRRNGPEGPRFACFLFWQKGDRFVLAVLPFWVTNFNLPYLLTRILVFGDSNCYVFIFKTSLSISKCQISLLYYFGRGSP